MTILYHCTLNNVQVNISHPNYSLLYICSIYFAQAFLTYSIDFLCIGVRMLNLYKKTIISISISKGKVTKYLIQLNYYRFPITCNTSTNNVCYPLHNIVITLI